MRTRCASGTTVRLMTVVLTWGLGVTAGLGTSACGDDSGKQRCNGADFCTEDAPQLELQPNDRTVEIFDAALDVGETTTRSIRLVNVGTGTLQIKDIALEYTPPGGAEDGDISAFRLQPLTGTLPIGIEPFGGTTFPQGLDVEILYTKRDALPRNARLVFKSNDIVNPTQYLDVTTDVGAPSLTVIPTRVDFGLVPKSDTPVSRTIALVNSGSRVLKVSGFKIGRDGRFGVRGTDFDISGPDGLTGIDLATAIEVPPGEQRPLEVTFLSDSPAPADGDLIIYSDDLRTTATGLVVPLVANKNGPCILVNPRRVAFGGKIVGSSSTITFEITSCGTEPLEIRDVSWLAGASPDFALDFSTLPAGFETGPTAAHPLSIPINQKATIGVVFVADAVNPRDAENIPIPDEGTIAIGSNAFESKVEVDVTGAGSDVDCPTPVIIVQEGEEVIPQTVLHLDARQSYAPFGGISAYNWELTSWPDTGPKPIMVPSFTDPQPVVEVNIVGSYVFKLGVVDEFGNRSGVPSCPDATYTVLVQPDQAIHVELTWVTPGDVDETDTGERKGSDLDLHFAHQNAIGPDIDRDGAPDPWFDDTWDVFWSNKAPNWASFDPSAKDDPSLDRDDTDGGGPENLGLRVPEDGVTYRIAAHYWDDWNFGPADATVKVFHYADLVYEAQYPALKPLDMWCVGQIVWPLPEVERCAPEGSPERVTPSYVNTFFQPPP